MSSPRIEVLLSSDYDYEKLTAELYCDGLFVALLNQDEGLENLKIEFPSPSVKEDLVLRKIELAVLEEGIKMAKKKLRL